MRDSIYGFEILIFFTFKVTKKWRNPLSGLRSASGHRSNPGGKVETNKHTELKNHEKNPSSLNYKNPIRFESECDH